MWGLQCVGHYGKRPQPQPHANKQHIKILNFNARLYERARLPPSPLPAGGGGGGELMQSSRRRIRILNAHNTFALLLQCYTQLGYFARREVRWVCVSVSADNTYVALMCSPFAYATRGWKCKIHKHTHTHTV